MAGLLEQLINSMGAQQVERVLPQSQQQPDKAAAASGAVMSMLVRGLQQKTQTQEGTKSLWDMITKQVQQGNLPQQAPAPGSGTVVQDLPPEVTDEILKNIFGDKASNVEHRMGKVITLDPETTKKIMSAVLPTILGSLFGQAEAAPQASPEALPDILGQARKELDQRQSKSGGIFDMLLDKDHDGDVDLSDLIGIFKG